MNTPKLSLPGATELICQNSKNVQQTSPICQFNRQILFYWILKEKRDHALLQHAVDRLEPHDL